MPKSQNCSGATCKQTYQPGYYTCSPTLVDNATSTVFCPPETTDTYLTESAAIAKYGKIIYQPDVWNTLGNGVGIESYNNPEHSKKPRSLQERTNRLISEPTVPYITPRDAPPQPIPLSSVINNHENYIFQNKTLSGPESARAKIPPIITPPIANTEYWRPNDFVVASGINAESNVDFSRSGYYESECYNGTKLLEPYIANQKTPKAPKVDVKNINKNVNKDEPKTKKGSQQIVSIKPIEVESPQAVMKQELTKNIIEDIVPLKCNNCCDKTKCQGDNPECVKKLVTVGPKEIEMMNDPFGYNPNQLEKSNIPGNLPVGLINTDSAFDCYNKDIFTTTIQPGVYSRTEVIEPIDSNMGISFTQQFEPVKCEKDCNGGVTFVQKDSRIIPIEQTVDIEPDEPNESNVYDPRFTGYGTNYRAYLDDMTGQPRFYYDDVQVHRQNNYITRNKIDFASFGPQNNEINQKYGNMTIRQKAEEAFLNNALDFRTELQTKQLRKKNVDSWQQKVAPIHQFSC